MLSAASAMQDLRKAQKTDVLLDVHEMIAKLNPDQKRVFDFVIKCLHDGNTKILRHFVSGTGGTGKSFLIQTIKAYVKQILNKNVAVSAPTGDAAFNINGLTIYRLLQLPVEHDQTPKYKQLSQAALKAIRAELQNVVLFVIDEISMVSNLTLLYIHLRLSEIFGTMDEDDGWFGKKNILFLGDFLQLPPVHEGPTYVPLLAKEIRKFVGALAIPNLWRELVTYDELLINMRQQGDTEFVNMLSRI